MGLLIDSFGQEKEIMRVKKDPAGFLLHVPGQNVVFKPCEELGV